MSDSTRAGLALASASVLAIAGFTALGSIFEYPQILKEPTGTILNLFREHQGAVMVWFAVLAIGAALFAPAGIWLGRLAGAPYGRWIAGTGIAAAAVQVIGLQRWVTIVPTVSDDALDPARRASAEHRFDVWHTVLGTIAGETIGYILTATFTVLVVAAFRPTIMSRWLAVGGRIAAVLIATGVLAPFLDAAQLANFVGYVLWCVWLLALAVVLIRSDATSSTRRGAALREAPAAP